MSSNSTPPNNHNNIPIRRPSARGTTQGPSSPMARGFFDPPGPVTPVRATTALSYNDSNSSRNSMTATAGNDRSFTSTYESFPRLYDDEDSDTESANGSHQGNNLPPLQSSDAIRERIRLFRELARLTSAERRRNEEDERRNGNRAPTLSGRITRLFGGRRRSRNPSSASASHVLRPVGRPGTAASARSEAETGVARPSSASAAPAGPSNPRRINSARPDLGRPPISGGDAKKSRDDKGPGGSGPSQ